MAARRFAAAGGTHLFLTTQGYTGTPPLTLEGYEEQFAITESLAEKVRSEAWIQTYVVVAPYPVDLISQASTLGIQAAVDLQHGALERAGHLVEEGRAVALGEVGRPHFETPPELGDAVQSVFRRALEVARDVGCPVVVHAAELDREGFQELARLAAQTSFSPRRIVKHYHRTVLPGPDYAGVTPSYLARRELVQSALATPGPWFLETDFLDDPSRPGAVLDLATVPRRALSIADHQPELLDRLRIPFTESIEAVYGFLPEIGTPRSA